MKTKQIAYSVLEIKASDGPDGLTIQGIASTPTPDRHDDIVDPLGAKFTTPMPLLWQHNHEKPVGSVTSMRPNRKGIPFTAKLAKVTEPGALKDRIDEARQSINAGLIRGVSIGFIPLEVERREEKGFEIKEFEIHELSLVTIPANAEATISNVKAFDRGSKAAGRYADIADANRDGASQKPINTKGLKMSIKDQLEALQSERRVKAARMGEIQEKAAEENRTKTEDERAEYNDLREEIKDIDIELQDLEDYQAINVKKTSTVVKGATAKEAEDSVKPTTVSVPKMKVEPGIALAQAVRCKALSKASSGEKTATEFARELYSYDSRIESYIKAAVGGTSPTVAGNAQELMAANFISTEFIEWLRPQTIIGKFGSNGVPGFRRVPFNVKVPRAASGQSGAWVGAGAHKPLSSQTFDTVTLGFTKCASISVVTDEVARYSHAGSVDVMIRDDLGRAIVETVDTSFIDPSNAGTANVEPAAISNGATSTASAGDTADDVRTDLQVLMNGFAAARIATGNIVLVMSEELKTALSLFRNSLGQSEFAEIDSGRLYNTYVVASDSVPAATVVAVDPMSILLADEGQVELTMSREATLEMDDAPGGELSTPTGATGALVSMFQANATAVRAERWINWVAGRTAGVQVISAATWNGAPSA